jgi:hypothetical protein
MTLEDIVEDSTCVLKGVFPKTLIKEPFLTHSDFY